ncbi:YggS family pyridoxal phosphate-dependent enzyme [Estrella lausannensis]|uniref:Pyridoxal phosphate homeostasis protein n=1 Tax=Estrella lausannensis TaxID=483423 RepID=A0A0H5E7S1_9BACT|nr:YggS family pyridoxal phosphate-dependent enzyme [Estrella lausannensis]CRX39385.1 Conserved hypothetical protein [Estrella lausannensis]
MTEEYIDYWQLLASIDSIAAREGRNDEVRLIAVSKNQPVEKLLGLYKQGCRLFGESKVQEWVSKKEALPKDIEWHFIGTLQKNKVRKVVGEVSLIHSIDSLELAKKVAEVSVEKGVTSHILLEVNTSMEGTKHGFTEEEVMETYPQMQLLEGISVDGLMTIGPNTEDEGKIRRAFKNLREIKEKLEKAGKRLPHLSMGMSHDFQIALEEGATLIRVGTLLFGERTQKGG